MGLLNDLEQTGIHELQDIAAQHGPAAQKLFEMLKQSGPGCVTGIVEAFKAHGLGAIASSWTGTGANQPVTGGQVQQVLGQDQIAHFAARLGIPENEAHEKLAQWLPMIIDKLTPRGPNSPANLPS